MLIRRGNLRQSLMAARQPTSRTRMRIQALRVLVVMETWNNIALHLCNARACIAFAMRRRAKLTRFAVAATKIPIRSQQTRMGVQGWTARTATAFTKSRLCRRCLAIFATWMLPRQFVISATRMRLHNLTSTKAIGWQKVLLAACPVTTPTSLIKVCSLVVSNKLNVAHAMQIRMDRSYSNMPRRAWKAVAPVTAPTVAQIDTC